MVHTLRLLISAYIYASEWQVYLVTIKVLPYTVVLFTVTIHPHVHEYLYILVTFTGSLQLLLTPVTSDD